MISNKKISGIYMILNIVNGKFYIGSSVNVNKRLLHHKNSLNKNKHHSILLQRAFNKYGKENFIFQLVEECKIEECLKREQIWLDFHQVYNPELGYNISNNTANPALGIKRTDEFKSKLTNFNKTKWDNMTTEERKNHPINKNVRKGFKISKSHLEKIKSLVHLTINSEKGKATRKLMAAQVNYNNFRKPIYQYDLEGNFIKEWDSIKEANLFFNKPIYHTSIGACCNKRKKTAHKFIWEFKNKIN